MSCAEHSEEVKEDINDLEYKVARVGAENDHALKANKLLLERIDKLKEFITDMHKMIKEAQETKMLLSPDHVNYFEKFEKILLEKKLSNFECLVDKALEAGKFAEDLVQNISAYKTKAYPYSYANPTRVKQVSAEPLKRKTTEKFILTEKQKRDKLIDGIFEEMKRSKKLPGYYLSSITRLEKLKLIRDYFQRLHQQ